MKRILLTSILGLFTLLASAQIAFSDATSDLNNTTLTSGVSIAIVDMNGDGLDDVVRLHDAEDIEIEYQQPNGTFVRLIVDTVSHVWGITIADIDENGYMDMVVGGFYDDLKLLLASNDGTSFTTSTLGGPSIFLQNANFADINNDGSVDLFACHDEGLSSPYAGDGLGGLTYDLSLINAESTVPSDDSGNYGSIWMDYDNDGDLDLYISKCRQGVNDPLDGRRLNLLFQNDGNNNYTDVAEAAGLRPQTQTWSSNFEDIDNDGDLDVFMINHDANHMIFENNGNGTFTDITASTGIVADLTDVGLGVQLIMEDFDNDTFVDALFTTTVGNHHLFRNNGNLTFSSVANVLPTPGNNNIQTAATGDLNDDGFLDLICGFADGFNLPSNDADMLFMNDGNSNNWVKMILEGVQSNINGIGARIELHGDWGMQIREVRAGESYGNQNSLITHFGIADATTIDQIVIKWPSGIEDVIDDPAINTTHTFIEGENLGVDDVALNSAVFYPNPSGDEVSFKLNMELETVQLTIHDVNGKQVLQQDVSGIEEQTLNIAQLSPGMYFVSFGNQTAKLIKN